MFELNVRATRLSTSVPGSTRSYVASYPRATEQDYNKVMSRIDNFFESTLENVLTLELKVTKID